MIFAPRPETHHIKSERQKNMLNRYCSQIELLDRGWGSGSCFAGASEKGECSEDGSREKEEPVKGAVSNMRINEQCSTTG